jgi:ADP-ribose pyrophosphatase YjhB (NUDIX family)
MIELTEVNHVIQKNILSTLMKRRVARFRDMRPPKTDTNLYSYHLTKLLKSGLVKKTEDGYTLGVAGLIYVDRLNEHSLFVRTQPKIITMLVIQNSNGDLLLQKRKKQPYIDTWSLPYGKLHNEDVSLENAAKREALEKLKVVDQNVKHAGDCYIRVKQDDRLLTSTLAHVFTFNRDDIATNESLQWVRPHKLKQYDLAPCVEEIVARTFFRDPFFFEEFETTW